MPFFMGKVDPVFECSPKYYHDNGTKWLIRDEFFYEKKSDVSENFNSWKSVMKLCK